SAAVRTWMSIAIAAGMHITLNLHEALAPPLRRARREFQFVVSVVAPCAVGCRALAGFVPALDEIVMHVGCRRSGDLDIDVMTFAFVAVAGRA
ncbi:MAG: hypothetical protein QOI53_3163, partial [Verrucomicrobiota bacterium]|nr:hypothetical protein [Verrucomicrobiota bacterium]